jgi:anti-sigma factor RsiW
VNCTQTRNLISGYLDGELDPVRSSEMEAHFQDCALCAAEYKNLQVVRDGIKDGSLYFNAPPGLGKKVQSSIRKAARTEGRSRMFSKWWVSAAVPLAAAAVLAVALAPLLRGPSTDDLLAREVLSSHVRSLMVNHLADVPSSDRHTVKPWFAGKLNFSPPVEDLVNDGYPLVGGRLDYLDNKPVAALIYHRNKHVINLFVWPSGSDSGQAIKMESLQGYNLIHWARSGMTYWAISDVNNSELEEFVQLIQKQTSVTS